MPMDGSEGSQVYGPVMIAPDRNVRHALSERMTYGLDQQRGGSADASISSLGQHAAALLHSPASLKALKAYREKMQGTSHLKQSMPRNLVQISGSEESSWHPGRYSSARGSGYSLLNSRATKNALRELQLHEAGARGHSHSDAMDTKGREALLSTKLRNNAGFTYIRSRKQALEAYKDLMEERLQQGPTESADELSGMKMARKERIRRESEGHGRRFAARLTQDSNSLQDLKTEIDLKETDLHSIENEERARRMEASDLQGHALSLEREEMQDFSAAEMSRRKTLREALELLHDKKRARHLETEISYEKKRADELKQEAKHLQRMSEERKKKFDEMAGPVKKAQEDVHRANQAYNAVELKLAGAETTAESLANKPKLAQQAMARIQKLQRESERMQDLVKTATGRLRSLESEKGAESFTDGIDSHFFSSKKRSIDKLQKAEKISQREDILRVQRDRIMRRVNSKLPELEKKIHHSKELHSDYLKLHNLAVKAQLKADKAKQQDWRLQHKMAADRKELDEIKREIESYKRQYNRLSQ
ncbi:hypothetical protein GUITHDRAFT_102066 [Guillardia theta CCMP2712]|uniref:Uncharacterized protein n=2 Tax=Guillardia theta TaxID=55529 RepID=L1JV15_GUITC|nr:hypothetical protein GUITHDRAFT_102066 [Guillardia theta CCMP2712]EKX52164.1 hypothetical protein GUITHDRAFT_102066 [Guillardia theta CCMP2712]|eukprot:XP_005839144.1 hypothetical protein GUITHDRAFT_102066 [Guillardia theta CCMP2712]